MFVIAYSKPQKRFRVKIIQEKKDHKYVHYIMRKREKTCERKKKSPRGTAANTIYWNTKLHLTNEKIVMT